MYDFDTPAPRAGSGALKGDLRGTSFGNPEALPFWVADSDYMSPPEIGRAIREAADRCVFGYNLVTDSWRRAVAGWIKDRHDWEIDPAWIVPSTGVVWELDQIVRCFTDLGDKVLIQTPVYDPFAAVVKSSGRTLVENRLIRDGGLHYSMDFSDLERDLASGVKLMVLCSPHNPVGRVWTEAEIRRVAELCEKHGALLVSDEIHWDIIMPGHRHFTAGRAGTAENVIVLSAPSKTFNVAGLKCSYAVIPSPALRRKLECWMEARHMDSGNNMGLIACEAAYTRCARWADEQNEYLAQNAALLREYFGERLPQMGIAPLQGTYLMWLDISFTGAGSEQVCAMMNRAGAVLNDGARYGDDGFVRLNIACPRAQLLQGLPRVEEGIRRTGEKG